MVGDASTGDVAPPEAPAFDGATVSNGVREYVRSLIMTGRIQAGDRLRVEHIAAELKISVTPVREALVELLADGFVERRPRRGYVVATLTRSGFEDRVLVLAMVTAELAARAAGTITSDELETIEQLQRKLMERDAGDDRVGSEQLNHRFHRTINLAACSPELAWTAGRFARYVPRHIGLEWKSRPRTCSYAHAGVIEALKAGNAGDARTAMFDHMVEASKLLSDDLQSSGLWPDSTEP